MKPSEFAKNVDKYSKEIEQDLSKFHTSVREIMDLFGNGQVIQDCMPVLRMEVFGLLEMSPEDFKDYILAPELGTLSSLITIDNLLNNDIVKAMLTLSFIYGFVYSKNPGPLKVVSENLKSILGELKS